MEANVSTNQRLNFKAWLRLMRWPNLLIIAVTQWVPWHFLIWPQLKAALIFGYEQFVPLCASTILIAAAGYIINDYFDIRIDAVNKPDRVILERGIPRRLAIIVHSVLNILALLLAATIAIPTGHPEWLLLQLACTLMLWRYSTTWKRRFMIGNVVVAALSCLTILMLILYVPVMQHYLQERRWTAFQIGGGSTINPSFILLVFAAFAFLLTWMREIVKDMEDYKGDDAEGCITMPIRWGLLRSTRFIQVLGAISVLMLTVAIFGLWRATNGWSWSAAYILSALIAPLVLWIARLPKAATAKHYHKASTQIKLIMVSGVVSLLVLSLLNYA